MIYRSRQYILSIQVSAMPTLINPLSALNQDSGNTIIGSTEERYFSGISSSFLSYSHADNHQGITLGFHNYGIEAFSLDTWSTSYGRQLSDNLQIGATLKYISLSIQEINSDSRNSSSDFVSSFWNLGAQLDISEQVSLHTEYQYDVTEQRSTIVAGIGYNPITELLILIGVNSTFQGPAIGLQYEWKSFFIAAGINNHFQLGQSGSLTMGGRF